jgi:hypothetical protein
VQDIFVIAKAMIEADATAGRTPPADLRDRVARALLGYLKTPHATRDAARITPRDNL